MSDTIESVEGIFELMDDLQIKLQRLLESLVKLANVTQADIECIAFASYPPNSKNPDVFFLGKYQVYKLDIKKFISGLETVPENWTDLCSIEEAEFLIELAAELILSAIVGVDKISIHCGDNKGKKLQ